MIHISSHKPPVVRFQEDYYNLPTVWTLDLSIKTTVYKSLPLVNGVQGIKSHWKLLVLIPDS